MSRQIFNSIEEAMASPKKKVGDKFEVYSDSYRKVYKYTENGFERIMKWWDDNNNNGGGDGGSDFDPEILKNYIPFTGTGDRSVTGPVKIDDELTVNGNMTVKLNEDIFSINEMGLTHFIPDTSMGGMIGRGSVMFNPIYGQRFTTRVTTPTDSPIVETFASFGMGDINLQGKFTTENSDDYEEVKTELLLGRMLSFFTFEKSRRDNDNNYLMKKVSEIVFGEERLILKNDNYDGTSTKIASLEIGEGKTNFTGLVCGDQDYSEVDLENDDVYAQRSFVKNYVNSRLEDVSPSDGGDYIPFSGTGDRSVTGPFAVNGDVHITNNTNQLSFGDDGFVYRHDLNLDGETSKVITFSIDSETNHALKYVSDDNDNETTTLIGPTYLSHYYHTNTNEGEEVGTVTSNFAINASCLEFVNTAVNTETDLHKQSRYYSTPDSIRFESEKFFTSPSENSTHGRNFINIDPEKIEIGDTVHIGPSNGQMKIDDMGMNYKLPDSDFNGYATNTGLTLHPSMGMMVKNRLESEANGISVEVTTTQGIGEIKHISSFERVMPDRTVVDENEVGITMDGSYMNTSQTISKDNLTTVSYSSVTTKLNSAKISNNISGRDGVQSKSSSIEVTNGKVILTGTVAGQWSHDLDDIENDLIYVQRSYVKSYVGKHITLGNDYNNMSDTGSKTGGKWIDGRDIYRMLVTANGSDISDLDTYLSKEEFDEKIELIITSQNIRTRSGATNQWIIEYVEPSIPV